MARTQHHESMTRSALIVLVLSFAFASGSRSDFNRTTGLIDIPTAECLNKGVVKGILNATVAGASDRYPAYLNFGLGYGFLGMGEVVLNAYTSKDYSAHVALRLTEQKGSVPAFALGIQELTYRRWISSVGFGDTIGFPDDVDYLKTAGRPSEIFSVYFVATRDLAPFGSYTLGVGRGRFVGYGPHSHWFNTDNFFRSDYQDTAQPISDLAFGLFMGSKWELFPGFCFMVEFDGRDGNAGVRYEHKYFDASFAATHLDQIGGIPELNPRISLGLSASTAWLYERPTEGMIAGRVTDAKTGAPLRATISFPGTEIASVETNSKGVFLAKLPVGTYSVQGNRDGYYWKQSKVTVVAAQTARCDFDLAVKPPPEELLKAERVQEHIDKGLTYFLEDRPLEAAAEWEAALKLDPNNEKAAKLLDKVRGTQIADRRSRALTYASRGQLREAIKEWEAVLSLDPKNREAMSQIVELEARLTAPVTRAPERKPPEKRPPEKKPPEKKASPEEVNKLFREGVSLFVAEKYKEAISTFNKVLSLNPGHKEAAKYKDRATARLKAMGG